MIGKQEWSRGISGHNAPRLEFTIGPGVGKRERLQRKGKEYMQEVWDVSHNVPHRSRVEAPWVMPPRHNGEPGKGREELADITCRDWTDAQGGQTVRVAVQRKQRCSNLTLASVR